MSRVTRTEVEALRFENVVFGYGGRHVLDDVSLDVRRGERVCLYGPSGCGKSTALRLICGLEKPLSGRVELGCRDIRPVFQKDLLLPFMTVRENAALFAKGGDVDGTLAALRLEDAAGLYPAQLSGGMARRAALTRALAGAGELYLFDEPFNGLDAENIDGAVRLILERTAGATVVCVLHDREQAARLGCRVIEMKR